MKKFALAAAATALATTGAVTATLVPGALSPADAANHPRSAYGANPHAGKNPNAQNGWGAAAWPNCPSASSMGVATSKSGDKAQVRKELVPLVTELMNRTESMGYRITQSGGFACRPIRGSNTVPSNHSKGKAVDLNWNANPMASYFKSDIPPSVVAMWERAGFYWGGRYTGRPDTMHFEYVLPPSAVPGRLAQLRGTQPTRPPTTKPTTKPQPNCNFSATDHKVWRTNRSNNREAVREVQCRLAAKGYTEVGAADGIFGSKTDAAVRRFQRAKGLVPDGIVGPKTWRALNG
ncbi:peptidoglycan-binding protein [Mariniluteicoccus flavus]